ncbi:MAG: transposase [Planctomycetota bacterium]|nr:transposase [Planctomycetota bacterium]
MADVLGYFLTWTTYGTWLPGDARGWIDEHRVHGDVVEPPNPALEAQARELMKEPPAILDPPSRTIAEEAMRAACEEFGWTIRAMEVRSNHVHVVVTASDSSPGKVMGVMKARATKALNLHPASGARERWWTKDGSKRLLTSPAALTAAIRYVENQDQRRPKDS